MPPIPAGLVVPKLFSIKVVSTEEFPNRRSRNECGSPIINQNPGNLGLFLPRREFLRKHFVENYVQSVFDAVGSRKIAGSTIAIGTDGSPLALELTRLILRLAAGNSLSRVVVGVHGRLSAPALSIVCREQESVVGFYLAGDGRRREGVENAGEDNLNLNQKLAEGEEKFVIQTFTENGGLASDAFNKEIFKKARYITKYRITNEFPSKLFVAPGVRDFFVEGRALTLEVIDPLDAYLKVLYDHFDFNLLRLWMNCFPKRVVVGVGGGQMEMYAKKIFGEFMGEKQFSLVDCQGAWKQADRVGDVEEIYKTLRSDTWDFGLSLSPDGRRCAFLDSDGHVINPSTMLALIADKAGFLPGFQKPEEKRPSSNKNGSVPAAEVTTRTRAEVETPASTSRGFARSATTSRAIDAVAAKRGVEMHVTPPEWRHLGTLLDADRVAIFGDDGFQMGSVHARVPDGIWAALATMSMLAVAEAEAGGADMDEVEIVEEEEEEKDVEKLSALSVDLNANEESKSESKAEPRTRPVDVRIIATKFYHSLVDAAPRILNPLRRLLQRHYEEFGRHFCVRMDYLSLNPKDALNMFEALQIKIRSPIVFVHAWFHYGAHSYRVVHGEDFQYMDPVEKTATLTTNCIRIFLHEGSIIAFRLCYAEDGLNFRIFVDKFEDSIFKTDYSRDATLLPLVKIAEEMCEVTKFTGKEIPDAKF